ncbi:hypothetical protein XENORESO_003925 [Xenotaenia resolanae]|uniref:Uncharacterized protein n=1 Tax=Xenotaenia resolanae TaxID=208358 RepID=A0ABV0VUR4_9TELE
MLHTPQTWQAGGNNVKLKTSRFVKKRSLKPSGAAKRLLSLTVVAHFRIFLCCHLFRLEQRSDRRGMQVVPAIKLLHEDFGVQPSCSPSNTLLLLHIMSLPALVIQVSRPDSCLIKCYM